MSEIRKIGDGTIVFEGRNYVNSQSKRVLSLSEFQRYQALGKRVEELEVELQGVRIYAAALLEENEKLNQVPQEGGGK